MGLIVFGLYNVNSSYFLIAVREFPNLQINLMKCKMYTDVYIGNKIYSICN